MNMRTVLSGGNITMATVALKAPRALVVLIALALAAPLSALAQESPDPGNVIRVFAQVDPGIFRGARPGDEGLQALARFGIKTDIDLENDRRVVEHEAEVAQALGMRILSVPLSGFWAPKDEAVTVVLNALADPSNYPVFIHCQ